MKEVGANPFMPKKPEPKLIPAIGKQVDSRRLTSPAASISGRISFGAHVINSHGPGPAAYGSISALGPQVLSTKPTFVGGATIGTASRVGMVGLDDAPGPGAYNLPTFVGAGSSPSIQSSPAFSIRGREKFGAVMDSKDAAKLPGPGAYSLKGNQKSIAHKIAGKWRERQGGVDRKPGPGTYKLNSGFGAQPLSNKMSYSGASLGTSVRKPLAGRPMTADVGPGQYNVSGSFGAQAESMRPSTAIYSFGHSGAAGGKNEHDFQAHIKKPQISYTTAMGKQILSHVKSQPKFSMSGRTKFGAFSTGM